LENRLKGSNLFVIYDAQVFALYGQVIRRYLKKAGLRQSEICLSPGEKTKSRTQLDRLYAWLLDEKVTRNDMIIAVGGGVISDLSGFVAATILRGVSWGVISTSLLGQVDAAIGGKTGINQKAGKNLIGSFWQPNFVLCDLCFLNTLPQRQMVNGFGEVARYAGLSGNGMIRQLDRFLDAGDLYDMDMLNKLVVQSVRYKARIVSSDEREAGRRMLLNLGHTFAHGIEGSLGYRRLYHGEAVVLGLLGAIELSIRHLGAKRDDLWPLTSLLYKLALPIPRVVLDPAQIINYMKLDKKRSVSDLRFVLLEAPGKPIIVQGIAPGEVRASVTAMVRYITDQGGKDA